jgi:hypothetical protein
MIALTDFDIVPLPVTCGCVTRWRGTETARHQRVVRDLVDVEARVLHFDYNSRCQRCC